MPELTSEDLKKAVRDPMRNISEKSDSLIVPDSGRILYKARDRDGNRLANTSCQFLI